MRWWDGGQWTGYTTPLVPWLPPDTRAKEARLSVWAERALVGWAVVILLQAGFMLYVGRTFHDLINNLGPSTTPGPYPRPAPAMSAVTLILDVGELAVLGLGIVFLIWQHSAATTARDLGYPARTSPGFGIGSWFIPIINLWYPYMALTDCLPPDHPLRPRAIWAWLGYLAAGFLVFVAFIASLISIAVALVPLALALAVVAFVVKVGTDLVRATEEDHRQRVAALSAGPGPW
jgi:hypothetical protein